MPILEVLLGPSDIAKRVFKTFSLKSTINMHGTGDHFRCRNHRVILRLSASRFDLYNQIRRNHIGSSPITKWLERCHRVESPGMLHERSGLVQAIVKEQITKVAELIPRSSPKTSKIPQFQIRTLPGGLDRLSKMGWATTRHPSGFRTVPSSYFLPPPLVLHSPILSLSMSRTSRVG